ncbi:scamp-domain-containing protein [Dichomitus squalens LYAD-421 SS1]|uniref:Scamp-domain-containing protein n=1 Tax=Dichomitus squalens TaxID=114155 RepID=A0A4Q9N5L9_9APHY|nr:scamp-domain-containing protein [Dichomitus squalens LYAD-421 SS1]EJF65884.1 scamp-domain-containing protein [Dichomitus squalens LYAD-421 SS1]TBU35950.1 scamp-domain-containing protein [Dichomitus squalens]
MSGSVSPGYNENPFASSHSLDTNPFEDPVKPTDNDTRLEELRQREADLARRERELAQKQDHIRRHGRNNWPPYFPLLFHSIRDEIPEASQQLITRLYQIWLVLAGTLVVNMVACICILASGSSNGGSDLGSSIGYVIFITPLSFLLWYRPIYNGYMKEQALYYYLFFFFGGFHLLFSVYMIIGIPSTGSAGLIQTIQAFTKPSLPAAIVGTVATVGWIAQGVGLAYYYRQIWAHHNAAGHSVEKAKTELATHGAKAYFTRG